MTRDWHGYLGHKAVLDSLPGAERFLDDLELNRVRRILRDGAPDGFYSYPTASASSPT